MKTYQQLKKKYYTVMNHKRQKLWQKVGVYGIYCNGTLVYVGKSTNMFHRMCSHMMNTFEPSQKEYNSKKYVQLRAAAFGGAKIQFRPIQFTDLEVLGDRQQFWIRKEQPPLNTVVGHRKKKVQSIEGLYKAG